MAGNVAKANAHKRWIQKESTLRENLLQPHCGEESVLMFFKEKGFHNLARQLQNTFNKLEQIAELYKEKNARQNALTHGYNYQGRPQSKRMIGVTRNSIKRRSSEMQIICGTVRDIIDEAHYANMKFDDDTYNALKTVETYLRHLQEKYVRAKKGNLAYDKRHKKSFMDNLELAPMAACL